MVSTLHPQKKIGVAIVGTGFGQKVHIPGLKAHHRTEVVAIYHRDINKAKAIAQAHDIPHASDNITDIVNLPEVQAVSIATPPFLHYEMAKEVLQAGKHLLLEKPTTLNVAEAQELYQLAQQKGVIATVDFEFRFVPGWQRFSQLLSADYVGNKRLIRIDWLGSSRADASRPWNWYSAEDKGGGALGSLGSHAFDYIYWLFGPVRRLSAHLSTAIPTRIDPASGESKPVETDDTCVLSLELADGTPCQLTISAVVHAPRTHWVEVYGDRGTLVLGSENQKDYIHGFRVWGSQLGTALTEIEIPSNLLFPHNHTDGRISAFIRVVDQWVQGIDRQQQLVPSLREGVYSQLLMDLSHQSHQTGSWVDVPNWESLLN
ncbi:MULTISPECIES: Gfo/Idh/MocA family protein [unclassified Tolypothrix]|uniref:Gfo/Idh/MocA family protein n=1 Tax=unclassified Tolypothrix TaxID=2649714 RepID=UPI0005EAB716|nr:MULTISPECIES: Gfo/Idh/MocA family oxidoreductase [unclassified Tolypothrix]BAY90093.1 oxidoreductase-like protein [Microchaete diplosiphon NIES-3275]EKE97417.1 oxidoreductase family, NAD-binding Rossmann fold protein [Tolypothrix sp. PCC 7601]MBE9085011.1 Gfo/Idh/MocA family oxidoreductase [Tolypothrix sp. LEGE 11397]UYD24311.1 Gfo/Idh/MocA family oxidoreductase [Tolypothrix sp. PCC 7712]UYD33457.1 Gfo/Idh/MocA family oxidoreductase [Tolypothrix sp. PCC 7601]